MHSANQPQLQLFDRSAHLAVVAHRRQAIEYVTHHCWWVSCGCISLQIRSGERHAHVTVRTRLQVGHFYHQWPHRSAHYWQELASNVSRSAGQYAMYKHMYVQPGSIHTSHANPTQHPCASLGQLLLFVRMCVAAGSGGSCSRPLSAPRKIARVRACNTAAQQQPKSARDII